MDLPPLIRLAVATSVVLLVFSLGLRATPLDSVSLFRQFLIPPFLLLRALLAMYVLVPLVAAAMTVALELPAPVEIAMLAMAVSPVPPILPGKQLRFGGRTRYVTGLWLAVSMAAIVAVPLAVKEIGVLRGQDTQMSYQQVAQPIALTILLPLVAGMIARRLAPGVADGAALWIGRLATGLLIGAAVPILAGVSTAMVSLARNGTLLALAVLATLALAIGHLLGGPDPGDRTTLAIASSVRHPGIALAIVSRNFSDEPSAPAAIFLFLLIGGLVTTIYGARRRHVGARRGPPSESHGAAHEP